LPANKADILAHRVPCEKQSVSFEHFVEVVRNDAGLNGDHQVVGIDLDDPVHLFEAADNAAGNGNRCPGKSAASSSRRYRCPGLVRPLHERCNLFGIGRKDDRLRWLAIVFVPYLVQAVALKLLRLNQQVFTKNLGQGSRVHCV
jgi:hypothetical protein